MILRYKGSWIRTKKEVWSRMSAKEKIAEIKLYLSEEATHIKENFTDYWLGYVDIHAQSIFGCEEHKDYVYSLTILAGRFGRGYILSSIGKGTAEKIVNEWGNADKSYYELTVDFGGGISQRYIFTKRQKNILVRKLKDVLEMEWHESEA